MLHLDYRPARVDVLKEDFEANEEVSEDKILCHLKCTR
jgi:hypothetical protein